MDLAKQAQIVDSIHDTLHDFVGQRLKVRANMGRSKIVESEGTLMQVHPQLFIMEVDRKRGRTAVSRTSTSTCSPAWSSCRRTANRCSSLSFPKATSRAWSLLSWRNASCRKRFQPVNFLRMPAKKCLTNSV